MLASIERTVDNNFESTPEEVKKSLERWLELSTLNGQAVRINPVSSMSLCLLNMRNNLKAMIQRPHIVNTLLY